ncbi:MAG: transglutaminase-like domain-containing protein [Chloroflexi bacterium]|nr:transglutaminase-like domain-containing protein [Chloroflexota bacterium]MCL5275327.1 transglutaminase-like domain-containing protein [Chloroflexota bacterium]
METTLNYFTRQGIISKPGEYAHLLDNLPADIAELCEVVQGTTIHIFWAERYGLKLPPERQGEVQLRSMLRRLARMGELYPRPLSEARPLDKKLVGNCRDFSLMLATILRHQGVPARARCGFGAYFLPNHYEDHWVCEYWNAERRRWILVDSQLDAIQRETLRIPFDAMDVPRDQFIVGGRAWQMCRGGSADPDHFGIFDMHGLGFVLGDFIRDVAALNKVELLPWDCWGIMETPVEALSPDDLAFLDHLADLTSGDVPDFATVHALYEGDSRLRVNGTVHNYGPAGVSSIMIA